jgi:hypothetical protein
MNLQSNQHQISKKVRFGLVWYENANLEDQLNPHKWWDLLLWAAIHIKTGCFCANLGVPITTKRADGSLLRRQW